MSRASLLLLFLLPGCVEGAGDSTELPEEEACVVEVRFDGGELPVEGVITVNPHTQSAYCAIACTSPSACRTADDCGYNPCVLAQCLDGVCVNVSYEDGSSCIVADPWSTTGEHHVGVCGGCSCVPKK